MNCRIIPSFATIHPRSNEDLTRHLGHTTGAGQQQSGEGGLPMQADEALHCGSSIASELESGRVLGQGLAPAIARIVRKAVKAG